MKSRGINKGHRSKASTGVIRCKPGDLRRQVERDALIHR